MKASGLGRMAERDYKIIYNFLYNRYINSCCLNSANRNTTNGLPNGENFNAYHQATKGRFRPPGAIYGTSKCCRPL